MRKNYRPILLIALLIGIAIYLFLHFYPRQTQIAEVSTTSGQPPITGTFYWQAVNFNPADQEVYFQELVDTGMDTVVAAAALGFVLGKDSNGIQITQRALSDAGIAQLLLYAKKYNLKFYWTLEYSNWQDTPAWEGSPDDETTTMGAMIAYQLEMLNLLKTIAAQNNIAWSDPTIAGIYISEEQPVDRFVAKDLYYPYYLQLIPRLKAAIGTDKKIILSPYTFENYTYETAKQGFINAYSIDGVDILAPQDSMGVRNVTTYAKSAELFRALRDAATTVGGGKEAWANVETFKDFNTIPGLSYNPTDIDKLTEQINAVAPYVSKIINFVYEFHFLSHPNFDSIPTVNQFIPDQAVRRTKLRNEYLEKYARGDRLVAVWTYYGNLVITGKSTLGQQSEVLDIALTYLDTGNNVVRTRLQKPIVKEGDGSIIYIALDSLPGFDINKPYTAAIMANLGTPTPTPSPSAIPGDFNGDGHVNIFDYNTLVAGFGTQYTIFDYNNLVANYEN